MKNYKFQCNCCGAISEDDDITKAVLNMKHEKGCDDELGAPWHPIPLYDYKYPNKPKV